MTILIALLLLSLIINVRFYFYIKQLRIKNGKLAQLNQAFLKKLY